MEKKELFESDKEDIKELYNVYGYSIRDISESEGVSVSEVKAIIGEKNIDTTKSISSQEISGKEYQIKLQKERNDKRQVREELIREKRIINNFRAEGCALARCPKCGEIMDDCEIRENNDGGLEFFYECTSCGFVDYKDKSCKDKCCRQGLGRLFEKYIPELVKKGYNRDELYEYINDFIETGW